MRKFQQASLRFGTDMHLGNGAIYAVAKRAGSSAALTRMAFLTVLLATSWHADANPRPTVAADFSRPASQYVASVAALRNYLKVKDEANNTKKSQSRQRFCFVQQHTRTTSPPRASVWMVWLEGAEIANLGQRSFTAQPSPTEAQWDGDALSEAKSIHLATDVRETVEEIYGSSFLVERAWVDMLLTQCKAKGRTVDIRPTH